MGRGTRARRSRRSGRCESGRAHLPRLAAVAGVEDTSHDVAARSEEGIASTGGGDALPAGREGELTGERRRHRRCRARASSAPVARGEDPEPSLHWVGQGQPAVPVEERHAVVERVGSSLTNASVQLWPPFEVTYTRESPPFPIERITALLASKASMSRNCKVSVPGGPTLCHVAPPFDRPQDGAPAAAGPDHGRADHGQATEASGRAGRRQLPAEIVLAARREGQRRRCETQNHQDQRDPSQHSAET